jgi:hypothetical protein
VPVILVSLNRLWRPDATDAELEDITKDWRKTRGERRDNAKYVFGVHNGVVRTIYRPENWRARAQGDRGWEDDIGRLSRRGFDAAPAPEMAEYLRTSVARFLTSRQWSHRTSDSRPASPKVTSTRTAVQVSRWSSSWLTGKQDPGQHALAPVPVQVKGGRRAHHPQDAITNSGRRWPGSDAG